VSSDSTSSVKIHLPRVLSSSSAKISPPANQQHRTTSWLPAGTSNQPGRRRVPSPPDLRIRLPQHPANNCTVLPVHLSAPLNQRTCRPACRIRSGPYNPRVALCEVQELPSQPVSGTNKCSYFTEICALFSSVPLPDPDNRNLFVAGLLGGNSTYGRSKFPPETLPTA
jgi:hypothetical protein